MLTSFQASPIAFYPQDATSIEDGPWCGDCADTKAQGITAQQLGEDVDEMFIHYYNTPAGFIPSSRYAVEENYPEGVECVECGAVIVDPEPEDEGDPDA